jgi:hypothetical protein
MCPFHDFQLQRAGFAMRASQLFYEQITEIMEQLFNFL